MATSEATTEAEPIPKRDDITKGIRNVFFRHLAHEGIMLERMQKQLAHDDRLKTFSATGKVEDLKASGEDTMGVNIGNEYHWHQDMQPTNSTPLASATTAIGNGTSRLWPLVLGLSLAVGGAGVGYIINDWLSKPAPVVDTDTDTITEMDFPQ